MNRKGQAALEYLMTYGWALIVIAIVVGVLVFIVSSPAGDIVCNSDQPNKIMVRASQIDGTGASGAATSMGSIQITNLTGGDVATGLTCGGSGGFAALVGSCPTTGMTSGEQVTLSPTPAIVAETYSTSSVLMTYDDYAGLERTATITCSGPIVITA